MTDTRRGTHHQLAIIAWGWAKNKIRNMSPGVIFRTGFKEGFVAGIDRSAKQYRSLVDYQLRLVAAARGVTELGPHEPAEKYEAAIKALREVLE